MTLSERLNERFGANAISNIHKQVEIDNNPIDYTFTLIKLQNGVQILMTNGLSAKELPVTEKHKDRSHIELYFCIPSYWDLSENDNPTMNWVFPALAKLHHHILAKNTWFGIGHTIAFNKAFETMSDTMKQRYFFFNEPWYLEKELKPIQLADKTVHFLAVIPIFEDEFDYKIGKGTYPFLKKLRSKDVTELLDDFRQTVLRSKWRFFG